MTAKDRCWQAGTTGLAGTTIPVLERFHCSDSNVQRLVFDLSTAQSFHQCMHCHSNQLLHVRNNMFLILRMQGEMNRAQQYIAILKIMRCDNWSSTCIVLTYTINNIIYKLFICLCLCSFTASCRKVSCRIRSAVNLFVCVLCDEFR